MSKLFSMLFGFMLGIISTIVVVSIGLLNFTERNWNDLRDYIVNL